MMKCQLEGDLLPNFTSICFVMTRTSGFNKYAVNQERARPSPESSRYQTVLQARIPSLLVRFFIFQDRNNWNLDAAICKENK